MVSEDQGLLYMEGLTKAFKKRVVVREVSLSLNAGEVVGVGTGVTAFSAGDRVVSNGPHAEFVLVPTNLCARIPDSVADEAAAFTVLGSIALQGIRLIAPTLGETVGMAAEVAHGTCTDIPPGKKK